MRRGLLALTIAVVGPLLGCAAGGDDAAPTTAPSASVSATSSTEARPSATPSSDPAGAPTLSPSQLRRELMRMARQDQGLPTKGPATTDQQRQQRLAEILDQVGWPTYDLVGKDGGDAAWLIAQHADLDPDLQKRALRLLRAAVADGQASGGNLAYLGDRVAAAEHRPQRYGTQIDCTQDGAVPRGGLLLPGRVDQLRRRAGLEPLADYLDTMSSVCSQ